MVLLIPDAYFNQSLDFVYLYSQFGAQTGTSDIFWDSNNDYTNDQTLAARTWENGDGGEEWAIIGGIPGEKSGVKFNDLNANGVQDPGEPGLAGWTIYAYNDTNKNGGLDSG